MAGIENLPIDPDDPLVNRKQELSGVKQAAVRFTDEVHAPTKPADTKPAVEKKDPATAVDTKSADVKLTVAVKKEEKKESTVEKPPVQPKIPIPSDINKVHINQTTGTIDVNSEKTVHLQAKPNSFEAQINGEVIYQTRDGNLGTIHADGSITERHASSSVVDRYVTAKGDDFIFAKVPAPARIAPLARVTINGETWVGSNSPTIGWQYKGFTDGSGRPPRNGPGAINQIWHGTIERPEVKDNKLTSYKLVDSAGIEDEWKSNGTTAQRLADVPPGQPQKYLGYQVGQVMKQKLVPGTNQVLHYYEHVESNGSGRAPTIVHDFVHQTGPNKWEPNHVRTVQWPDGSSSTYDGYDTGHPRLIETWSKEHAAHDKEHEQWQGIHYNAKDNKPDQLAYRLPGSAPVILRRDVDHPKEFTYKNVAKKYDTWYQYDPKNPEKRLNGAPIYQNVDVDGNGMSLSYAKPSLENGKLVLNKEGAPEEKRGYGSWSQPYPPASDFMPEHHIDSEETEYALSQAAQTSQMEQVARAVGPQFARTAAIGAGKPVELAADAKSKQAAEAGKPPGDKEKPAERDKLVAGDKPVAGKGEPVTLEQLAAQKATVQHLNGPQEMSTIVYSPPALPGLCDNFQLTEGEDKPLHWDNSAQTTHNSELILNRDGHKIVKGQIVTIPNSYIKDASPVDISGKINTDNDNHVLDATINYCSEEYVSDGYNTSAKKVKPEDNNGIESLTVTKPALERGADGKVHKFTRKVGDHLEAYELGYDKDGKLNQVTVESEFTYHGKVQQPKTTYKKYPVYEYDKDAPDPEKQEKKFTGYEWGSGYNVRTGEVEHKRYFNIKDDPSGFALQDKEVEKNVNGSSELKDVTITANDNTATINNLVKVQLNYDKTQKMYQTVYTTANGEQWESWTDPSDASKGRFGKYTPPKTKPSDAGDVTEF